jgi:hypothetical protein
MGAWGEEPFENDDAADWSYAFDTLDAGGGVAYLRAALAVAAGAHEDEEIEAPDGSIAVAAADVVERVRRGAALPETYGAAVTAWASRTAPELTAVDVELAAAAVQRVLGPSSELAELWDDAGPEWRTVTEALAARLNRDG